MVKLLQMMAILMGREHGFDGSSNGTDLRNHPSIGFNRCFPAPPARDSPKIVA